MTRLHEAFRQEGGFMQHSIDLTKHSIEKTESGNCDNLVLRACVARVARENIAA